MSVASPRPRKAKEVSRPPPSPADHAVAGQVALARTDPPDDTRAWARGQAIKWASAHARSGGVAWHRVWLGKFDWRWFTDPMDPRRDRTDRARDVGGG